MNVSVRLFAGLRDAVGARLVTLDLPANATIVELKQRLGEDYPAVSGMLETAVAAIDDEYVSPGERVREHAEVALIPPVSGGAPDNNPEAGMSELFRITTDVLDGQALVDLVGRPEAGAVTLFYGNVRNFSEGRDVQRLEYEAHESMALKKMREVAADTKRAFPDISEIGVWHRIGTLEIGETSLLVAVSSPHRKESFDACHWAVDRIKEVVPVWKKEHWADGAAWVEGHAVDAPETAST